MRVSSNSVYLLGPKYRSQQSGSTNIGKRKVIPAGFCQELVGQTFGQWYLDIQMRLSPAHNAREEEQRKTSRLYMTSNRTHKTYNHLTKSKAWKRTEGAQTYESNTSKMKYPSQEFAQRDSREQEIARKVTLPPKTQQQILPNDKRFNWAFSTRETSPLDTKHVRYSAGKNNNTNNKRKSTIATTYLCPHFRFESCHQKFPIFGVKMRQEAASLTEKLAAQTVERLPTRGL